MKNFRIWLALLAVVLFVSAPVSAQKEQQREREFEPNGPVVKVVPLGSVDNVDYSVFTVRTSGGVGGHTWSQSWIARTKLLQEADVVVSEGEMETYVTKVKYVDLPPALKQMARDKGVDNASLAIEVSAKKRVKKK